MYVSSIKPSIISSSISIPSLIIITRALLRLERTINLLEGGEGRGREGKGGEGRGGDGRGGRDD